MRFPCLLRHVTLSPLMLILRLGRHGATVGFLVSRPFTLIFDPRWILHRIHLRKGWRRRNGSIFRLAPGTGMATSVHHRLFFSLPLSCLPFLTRYIPTLTLPLYGLKLNLFHLIYLMIIVTIIYLKYIVRNLIVPKRSNKRFYHKVKLTSFLLVIRSVGWLVHFYSSSHHQHSPHYFDCYTSSLVITKKKKKKSEN